MAATLIEPADIIEVKHLPVLIYGPPGCGKTSLAQTAANPLTLDFDKGIHRAFNRKRAMRFDTWQDCVTEQEKGAFKDYSTLNLDTLGALLDAIARHVMQESAKNTQGGGLSIQGWGVLGNRFGQWVRGVVANGQDIVMVCHEEEEKDVGGNRYLRPAMPGKMAYTAVHRLLDLMGHITYDGRVRSLDFNPTDLAIGKNSAGWEKLPVGRLEDHPTFLADLLADAKTRIGKTAVASAAVAKATDTWQARLNADPTIDELNAMAAEVAGLNEPEKTQAWKLVAAFAKKACLVYDRKSNTFGRKEAAA